MTVTLSPFTPDNYEEPLLTRDQVQQLLDALPLEIQDGLRELINATIQAQAPGPFSDALGALEAYLDALEHTGHVPFEQQIQLKDYVMAGWRKWRAEFAALKL